MAAPDPTPATGAREGRGARYQEIAGILARHGLGYAVGVLGLERFVPFHRGWLGHPRRRVPYTRPEHLRMVLEDLGTTFIKLGQILSTRADLLPPEYQSELAKLQDAAPPVPWEVIAHELEQQLGRPPEESFAAIDPVPLAAASIGQAHAAVLAGGTEVVVKVRRPGVVPQVERDLGILEDLAATASRRWELADRYDVVGIVQEFGATLRAEMDYVREGHSAERFAAAFAGDPNVHIPRIFWEFSTGTVLTLERIRGARITDTYALAAAGVDPPLLAQRAARLLLKMVFEDSFFHADPHPGNFFVEPGGRIGLIDFGMVGTVDQRTQDQLIELLVGITGNDAAKVVDTFISLGIAQRPVDRAILQQDVEHLISRYYGRPLGEMGVGAIIGDAFDTVRRHGLQLPPNLVLLLKTVAMAEGVAVQVDPSFRLAPVLAPYAESLMFRRYSPVLWGRRFAAAGADAAWLATELPQHLRRLLGDLERGRLEIAMRPTGVEPQVRRLERAANRLVLGVIASAFVVGLAVLLSFYQPPGMAEWGSVLLHVGFVTVAILAVVVAWGVFRSGG